MAHMIERLKEIKNEVDKRSQQNKRYTEEEFQILIFQITGMVPLAAAIDIRTAASRLQDSVESPTGEMSLDDLQTVWTTTTNIPFTNILALLPTSPSENH